MERHQVLGAVLLQKGARGMREAVQAVHLGSDEEVGAAVKGGEGQDRGRGDGNDLGRAQQLLVQALEPRCPVAGLKEVLVQDHKRDTDGRRTHHAP